MIVAALFIIAGLLLGFRLTSWFSSVDDLLKRATFAVTCGFSILLLTTYSLALQFSELSVPVVLLASAGAFAFSCIGGFRNIDWKKEWRKTDWMFLATILLFVLYFAAMNFNGTISWHGTDYRGSHTMWGDYGIHMSIASSFAYAKNFPPVYPFSPGTPLGYSFLVDFFAAVFMVCSLPIGLAFQLSGIILFFGLMGCLLFLAYSLLRSRRAVLIFLFIFMFNSTIGSVQALSDVLAKPDTLLHPTTDYTLKFDGDKHVWSSTLVSFLFPQRGFLLGLAIAALVIYAFLEESKNRSIRFWVLAGVLLGSLAYAHAHSLLATAVILTVLTIIGALQNHVCLKKEFFSACKAIAEKRLAPRQLLLNALSSEYVFPLMALAVVGVVALLVGGPQLLLAHAQAENVPGFSGPFYGWLATNAGKSVAELAVFYLIALWIPLWLGLAGLFTTKSASLRNLFIAAFIVFLLANVYKFQGWDWDNNKLIFYFFLAACLLAADFLARVVLHLRTIGALLACLILLFSTAGALLDNVFYYQLTYTIYNDSDFEFAEWIKANTWPAAVFATGTDRHHPAAILAGRPAIAAGSDYWWVHGLNTPQMVAALEGLKSFYHNPSCGVLATNNLSFVAVTPHENEYDPNTDLLDNATFLTRVYDTHTKNGRYTVYRVSCNG